MTTYQATVRYGQMFQVGEFFTAMDDLVRGDPCVIRSERGMEVGVVLTAPQPISPDRLLEEGRREILRRVTEQDRKKLRVLDREGRTREWSFCLDRIRARGLKMRLTKVEHLFGGDKIVFYYTADGRIDFRGLVKDLASEFKCKILMRQIGARDEARLLGDYNSCGQELCCTTFIKDFKPITMKMAKNQMTTLDPAKITGRCGRLMCCLRYEDDNYVEMKKQLPRKGKRVRTREGTGVVVGYDVLAQRVTVSLDGGRRQSFPAQEVLRLEKKGKNKKKERLDEHLYLTVAPLWQDRVPDATVLYSLVAADVIGRYQGMLGHDVHFPVILARYPALVQSGERELGPEGQFISQVGRILDRFQIRRNQLFQTSSPHHQRTVADFCRRLLKVGDLYRQDFRGWQCTRCYMCIRWAGEEREQCLHCGSHLEKVEGPCYFFKLSSYQRKLLATIQTGDDRVKPQILKLELESRLKRGLEDTVIARSSYRRGLSVPGDEDFQLAGWFESLLAYVSCLLDEDKNELFYQYWPAQYQLVSKDWLWNHGVLWLSMLLASKIDLPRRLIVHGRWTGSAEPANLTASGSFMMIDEAEESDPGVGFERLAEEFGSDSLRYYFLRDVPFGLDAEFHREHFLYEIEQELGKDLGKLVSRVFTMVEKYFDGVVPPASEDGPDRRIKELLQDVYYDVRDNLQRLQFSLVLRKLREAWRKLGGYLDEVKPWKLAKNDEMRSTLSNIIYSICESIRILSVFLWPIMPETAEALHEKLGISGCFDFSTSIKWGGLAPGAKIDNEQLIFPYDNFMDLPRDAGAERVTKRRVRH